MALRDIQVEYRRRGVTKTKVMAARCAYMLSSVTNKVLMHRLAQSLVTANEAVCLTGIDHATLSGAVLELLSSTELTPKWEAVANKAVAAYKSPGEPTKTESMQFSLEEPATELRNALAEDAIVELLNDALARFQTAETGLIQLAQGAMKKL